MFARELRIEFEALSIAPFAALTAWSRDSLVGGGMGTFNCKGLCWSG